MATGVNVPRKTYGCRRGLEGDYDFPSLSPPLKSPPPHIMASLIAGPDSFRLDYLASFSDLGTLPSPSYLAIAI